MTSKYTPPHDSLDYGWTQSKPLFNKDKALPADIISKWLNDHVYDPIPKALRVTMDTPFSHDSIFLEDEFADPLTRLGMLHGGVDPDTDEFHAFRVNSDGRLLVDANITIQSVDLVVEIDVLDGDRIGIWGYEDGDKDIPVPVNVTSEGHLRVSNAFNENMSILFNEGIYSGSVEHSLISHTVGLGEEFNCVKVTGEGRTNGVFKVKINGSIVEKKRNAWTDRNVEFNYQQGLPLIPGDTIELTVVHNELTSKPFSGTIYGEDA